MENIFPRCVGLDVHKESVEACVRRSEPIGDRFRIQIVTLVGLHLRLHRLSRHQSHLLPLLAQSSPQRVRSTTGLHADQLHF
jgi:hypothetical protein